MGRPKKSHDVVRKMDCYKCGGKAKSNDYMGQSGKKLLQQALQALFSAPPDDDAQYWTHHWEHEKHPSALCGGCRVHLNRLRDAQFHDPEGIWSDFVEHDDVPVPHSQDGKPVCKMCRVIRSGGPNAKNPYGKKKAKKGRRPVLPPDPVPMCPDCGIPATKGDGHKCTHANRVAAMKRLTEKDEKASQMFAAQVIQSTPGSPGKGTKRLTRALGGAPLPVQVTKAHPVRKKKSGGKRLSAADVSKWEATTNMTTRMRNKSVAFLNKQKAGTFSEGNIKQKILDEKKLLEPYFKLTEKEIGGKRYLIAHVENILQYVEFILEKRGPEAQHRQMIGEILHLFPTDWGRGFLKLSLNLIDMINARDPERAPQLSGFHDSGLKGVQIVAIAKELKESHEAFQEFFRLIKLELVSYYWLAADFKVDNFVTGIQTCSSTYPCPFCIASIHNFDTEAALRTIQGIRDLRDLWINRHRGNRNELHKVYGCEFYPALPGREPEEEILNILAPDELHIILGITNKVLTRLGQTPR